MKTCTKCKQEKPFSDFHKDKTSKTGFRSRCKVCCAEDSSNRYYENPQKHIAIARKWQDKNKEKVVASRKAHYKNNKEKLREVSRKYREQNPDKTWEHNKKYYEQNKEREKLRAKIYRQQNPDKVKEIQRSYILRNKEKVKQARLKYKKENPEIYKIINQNRRARKLASNGRLSSGLAQKLYALQNGKCACCKKPLGANYHMDHIMPLVLGGSNTDDNIQLLRAQCNNQKYSKHPVDFMQERGYLL
jgi:hypothetical protein